MHDTEYNTVCKMQKVHALSTNTHIFSTKQCTMQCWYIRMDDMTWESSRVAEKEVSPNISRIIYIRSWKGWSDLLCLIFKHFPVDFPMLTFIFGGCSTEPGEQYHPMEEGGHAGLFFFLLN